VMRYGHNVERVLNLPSPAVALLAVLMLRGPQTAGELRINCDRLHRFADISAVEGYLNELAARAPEPLVMELPRQPGTRETRWTHLVSGVPDAIAKAPGASPAPAFAVDDLRAELAKLRDEVSALRVELEQLRIRMT